MECNLPKPTAQTQGNPLEALTSLSRRNPLRHHPGLPALPEETKDDCRVAASNHLPVGQVRPE